MRHQSFSFDYLQQISQYKTVPLAAMATYPHPDAYGLTKETAFNGYAVAHRNKLGALVQWNSSRPDMGIQTTYSGMAIAAYMEHGVSSFELFRFHSKRGDRLNRIDLAIDVRDTGVSIHKLYKRCEHGKIDTRCEKIDLDISTDGGATLYVGARTSDKCLRIYDKAAERHIEGIDWKRIELECKGDVAYQLGRKFATMSDDEIIAMSKAVIRNHIDFRNEWWHWATGNIKCPIVVPQKKNDDLLKWLDKQVVPALANYIKRGGNPDVIRLLEQMVNDRLRE
ncbi:MAG TPA: replication initiation factor domain-containing protein [Oculatellaceae cyanobacterium]